MVPPAIDGEGETEKSLEDILGSSLSDSFDAAQTLPDDPQEAAGVITDAPPSDATHTRDPATGQFVARRDGADTKPATARIPDQGLKPGDGAAAVTLPSDAPASWSAAAKAHWKTLPPDVQAEAHRREADFSKGIEQKTRGLKAYETFESIIAPRRAGLAAEYGSAENAISQLFKLSDFAAQDKPGFIRWFCNAHNLNPQTVFGGAPADAGNAPQPGQGEGEQNANTPPELAAVLNRVHELEAQIQQVRLEPVMHQAKSELEKFEAEVPAKFPHWAKPGVKESVAALLERTNENLTYEQAYDRVVWSMPDIRQQLIEQERTAAVDARAKEAADAAKKARTAAGPQLRSVATPGEFRAAPAGIDQTLADTYDRVNGAA